jgi:predicted CoA-binding protein
MLHSNYYLTKFYESPSGDHEPLNFNRLKKKTLVLGASLNPSRYSYLALNRLAGKKHQVVAVGLKEGIVAGVPIITEKFHFDDIDTITLYLNAQRQVDYYEYILSLKPRRVIFNPGTRNPELASLLQKNNIEYEEACTLVLLGTDQY